MELVEQLQQFQQGMSRFRRVALHLHSPGSYDWGTRSADPSDASAALRADPAPYLNRLTSYYDLVAITDHMQARFACEVCRDLADCVVLPGMELAVRLQAPFDAMRIHFLVVFPEDCTLGEVDRIFLGKDLVGPEGRSGREELRVRDVVELANIVHKAGGILVAAHVDSDAGYRAAFRDVGAGVLQLLCKERKLDAEARKLCDRFKQHLIEAGVDAVEIDSLRDVAHYRFTIGDAETEVATVLRNDAHSLSELEAGRCTYVKMTDVNFRGLRQALRFPDTRVRHKPLSTQPSVLHAIRIRGGTGSLEDMTVAFSPNLSCLIGARGTGKSAIVDAIRYVFGYNRKIGKRIGDDLKKQVESRQQATLAGTTIELLYSTESGELYALSSVYDAKRPYVTGVSDREGRDTRIADVEKDGRFPCRLYGWSEVEHLGRRADHQRDLLDHMLGLHSLVAERDKLLGELSEERIHLEALAAGLERAYEERSDLQRLKEVQQSFDFIKEPDVEPLFVKVDSANQALASAKRWEEKIGKWLHQLEKACKLPQPTLDDQTNALWKAAKGEELIATVETAATRLIALGNDLVAAATQLRVRCEQRATAAAAELADKLEGKADIKELARKRTTIGKQLDNAREQEQQYKETLSNLMDALARRRQKVSHMREMCDKLSTSRKEGIDRIGAALSSKGRPSIGITMSPSADTARYEAWLTATLKSMKPYQTRDRIIAALKASFGPEETTSALLQGSVPGSGLRDSDTEILRESVLPFFVDASSGVKRVRPEILSNTLECDECPCDDYVEVTLEGKPIGDLSPGQRCSALLPIILLGSEAPLVLDQPEDNLDNQLITDLLIQTLHRLKERRQVIVVTHNPNIVVTGDAEQVVVMEAGDGRCRVRRQASVDRVDVMRDIVDLMEGGREALRRRFKRYWPEEDVPELSFLNDTQ